MLVLCSLCVGGQNTVSLNLTDNSKAVQTVLASVRSDRACLAYLIPKIVAVVILRRAVIITFRLSRLIQCRH